MCTHYNILFVFLLSHSGEATNANCIVFGLTRSGLEPTIYRTRSEHANLHHWCGEPKNPAVIR
jgi:hypothetical protein